MTAQPPTGPTPPQGPPATSQAGGTLGREAAIAIAVALGLLSSQGLAYTKSMKGASAAEKAIDALLKAIEKIAKDGKSGNASKAEIEKDFKALVDALKNIAQLVGKDQKYLNGYSKNTQDVKKNLLNFLKGLIKEIGQDLGNKDVTSGSENAGLFQSGKILAQILDGKPLTPQEEKDAFGEFRMWMRWGKGITGTLTNRLADLAARASQQWSQYSTRAKLTTSMVNRWMELAQKSQDILAKTMNTIITKY